MQAWTKDKIVETLENPLENRKAVSKMLQALYNKQTEGEKLVGETAEHNGAGFNGVDTPFLSSVAESSKRYKGNLTDGQTKAVAKTLKKYATQLAKISAEVAKKTESLQTDDNADELNTAKEEGKEEAKAKGPERSEGEEPCKACEEYKRLGFGPSHNASRSCRSGGYPHCTCDTCF
jgi:hypothetical protein